MNEDLERDLDTAEMMVGLLIEAGKLSEARELLDWMENNL
jgi:hypothetical protein